jgi:hypothetical protein
LPLLESFNCFTRDTLFPSAGEWLPTPSKEILTRLLTQLPKIQQIELYLERKAKAEVTIQTYVKALKEIAKRADLNNPVEVELAISRYKKKDGEPCSNRWKNQCCDSYFHYCKVNNIQWERVHYQIDERSIQPPSPEKCLMLMTRASGQLSLKIDISIQTGLRPVEVTGIEKGLRVRDIHFDTKTITPTSAKGCNARPPIPITAELCARIQTHILKHNLAFNDRLFKEKSKSYGDSFRKMKNRLAIKLCDPSIKGIRLYDIRHAYITKMLRKIQNPEMVRIKVGHKRLNTTQKYFHLLADQSGELIVETTNDKERAKQLLTDDFTYQLTTPDGYMIFRKAK